MVQLSSIATPAAMGLDLTVLKAAAAAAAAPAAGELQESAAERSSLLEGFRRSPKHLPCSYLYDTRGSDLYEEITALEEYYPFKAEQALLTSHAEDIISHIPKGSVLVELGCGSAAKTAILLSALLQRDGPQGVRFAGIDVSGSALAAAKESLLGSCHRLLPESISLVCAEYIEGVRECRRRYPGERLVVLWLGSSVGNLAHAAAVEFFKDVLHAGGQNLQIFLCADLWKDTAILRAAYHDSKGVTEAFIKNGMQHALRMLSCEDSGTAEKWDYEVVVNTQKQQVEMWLVCKAATGSLAPGIGCALGERVLVEVSRKFTPQRLQALAYDSGLYLQAAWRTRMYSMQMLLPPLDALQRCWSETDAFFSALPDWWAEPIAVRRPFGFYYGHMAAFLKLKLFPNTPVVALDGVLSRGIDPDLGDPSVCHAHPAPPPTWPSEAELRAYAARERARLEAAIAQGVGGGSVAGPGGISMRGVCLALEHERMHQETLAYMRTQQVKSEALALAEAPGTPPGSPGNELECAVSPELVTIPSGEVQLGVPTDGSAGFVWDNEGPAAAPQLLPSFSVAAKPVTVAEFHCFAIGGQGYSKQELWTPDDWDLIQKTLQRMPAGWSQSASGAVTVHSVVPAVLSRPWTAAAGEAVHCSLAEAAAFCRWRGGGARVMSEAEWQRLCDCPAGDRVEQLNSGGWEWTSTPFAPFPGFKAMQEYEEYSADFFDGKHFVLRGSSAATAPALRRQSFRNYYQRGYPYVFAKFRCCYDAPAL